MSRPASHVSLIARHPQPGTSKTRLIPALGEHGAARVALEMGRHVARQLTILATDGDTSVDALIEGDVEAARQWLRLPVTQQRDGDLGVRLDAALLAACEKAPVGAVVGGDCPTLDAAGMRECLRAASDSGAAIVPASDGGFLMLAVAAERVSHVSAAFDGVEWSTGRVCSQVLDGFRHAGVTPPVLATRVDIDRPEDLPAWEAVRHAWYDAPQKLGVVIPALNEADHLPELLRIVLPEADEVVVVDGGSTDGTADVARAAGARAIESPKGRGRQMNAGAAALTSDAVLFLHADSLPRPGFRQAALETLADPTVALGAFGFSLDATEPVLRVIEGGTNLRARVFSLPYGDQGLFLRKVMFDALGGFPEALVLEDLMLVERARKVGRVEIAPHPLVTSDRRWREVGPWRWTALNLATLARHRLGASPDELARWRNGYLKR